jgi:[acyl-carrier-protein] S-malonyltransferase
VVSNEDAIPHGDAEGWRQRLVDHLVRPVRWRQTMERFVALGVTDVVEVGPGSTLTALARRALPEVTTRAISTPDDVAVLQDVRA